MIKALILAAGYATRLYPLTKEYPKPLLKVRGKPIIEYITDKLNAAGEIEEIFVITNSKFFPHFKKWQKKARINKPIKIIDDLTRDNADRLGAVGDMHFAIEQEKIGQDLLIAGGDNIFDESLDDFITFAKSKGTGSTIGVYDIKGTQKAKKYGVIGMDERNQVVAFEEKPKDPLSTLVAMCLYYFPKRSLEFIKEYMSKSNKNSDTTGSYIDWLRKKAPVYAFVFGGRWYDIGDLKFYNEAREKFSKGGERNGNA
ncbi:MAG: nucleotidyltransferase family protein [Candidatus Omnitrophota bacterium]